MSQSLGHKVITHTSATAATATSVALAANSNRRFLAITNTHATDAAWIQFVAAATAAIPSVRISAGVRLVYDTFVPTSVVNCIRGGSNDISMSVEEG
jgi:hypothetical protein